VLVLVLQQLDVLQLQQLEHEQLELDHAITMASTASTSSISKVSVSSARSSSMISGIRLTSPHGCRWGDSGYDPAWCVRIVPSPCSGQS